MKIFKLYIHKGFGINKDTAVWLCPWAVVHAPPDGTLFAEPVGQFGRGPSWSGHQSHKVLLRALGSVPSSCSSYHLELTSKAISLLSLLTCVQPNPHVGSALQIGS